MVHLNRRKRTTFRVNFPVLLSLVLMVTSLTLPANAKQTVIVWGNKNYTGITSDASAHHFPNLVSKSFFGTPMPPITAVVSKRDLTLAMTDSGELWIWGVRNGERLTPRAVSPSLLEPTAQHPIGLSFQQIEGASNVFYGLDATGGVYSWVWSDRTNMTSLLSRTLPAVDPMSDEYLESVTIPGKVEGLSSPIFNFRCADTFCLALNSSGSLFMWLSDTTDTLINNLALDLIDPQVVWNESRAFSLPVPQISSGQPQAEITRLATGYNWYFLVTSTLEVYMTGINSNRRLGLNSVSTSQRVLLAPMETNTVLKTLGTPQSVSAGRNHALWLTDISTSRVYAWGSNEYHQLGSNSPIMSATPILVNFPSGEVIVSVSAVWDTSYALNAFGTIYVWGSNHRCTSLSGCSELSFGMLGDPNGNLVISSATPSILPLPSGVYARSLPVLSYAFDPTIEDPREWETRWAITLIGDDQDADALVPETESVLISWGSYDVEQGVETVRKFVPIASPQTSDLDWFGYGTRQTPLPKTVSQICVFEDAVRILTYVGKYYSILAIGRLENSETKNMTVPYPPISLSSIKQHPPSITSRLVNLTQYQQVSGIPKTNISRIALSAHSLVVQSGDGRVTSYIGNVGYPRGTFWVSSRIDCAAEVCSILDEPTGEVHTWLDRVSPSMSSHPLLGRSLVDQTSGADNTIPQALVFSEPVKFISFGVDFGVATINTTTIQNMVYTWGSNEKALGGHSTSYTPQPMDWSKVNVPSLQGARITSISTGKSHGLLVLSILGEETILVGWGDNTYGQVGPFYSPSEDVAGQGLFPRILPFDTFLYGASGLGISIACVRDTSFANLGPGVLVWGFNGFGLNCGSNNPPILLSSTFGHQSALLLDYEHLPISSASGYSAVTNWPPVITPEQRKQKDAQRPLLFYGSDNDLSMPFTAFPGETLIGSQLLLGEMTDLSNILFVAFSSRVRFFADQGGIYVSGDAWKMPSVNQSERFPYNNSTRDSTVVRPSLLLSIDVDNQVHSFQAFGEGLVVLLTNGTVRYWVPSYNPIGGPHVYSLAEQSDEVQYGMRELSIRGETNLRISNVNCDYWACCFTSRNLTAWCFGQLLLGSAVPVADFTSQPQLSRDDTSFGFVAPMTSRSGIIYNQIDGSIYFAKCEEISGKVEATEIIDITGESFGYPAKTISVGISHVVTLSDGYGVFVTGWNDSLVGLQTRNNAIRQNTTLEPLVRYHPEIFHSNVQEISAWLYSILVLLENGELWYDGLGASNFETSWQPVSPYSFMSGPTRVPISSNWTNPYLFDRRSYDESSEQPIPFHFVIKVSRTIISEPISPPTSDSSCRGSSPSPTCGCNHGAWFCNGDLELPPGITIGGRIIVGGNLFAANGFKIVMDSTLMKSELPLLLVTGCAYISQPIDVEMDGDAVNSISSKGEDVVVLQSTCPQSLTNFYKFEQTGKKCKQVEAKVEQLKSSTVGTAYYQVHMKFSIKKNTCDNWWIILISVLGAIIIVIIPLMLLIFLKTGLLAKWASDD